MCRQKAAEDTDQISNSTEVVNGHFLNNDAAAVFKSKQSHL